MAHDFGEIAAWLDRIAEYQRQTREGDTPRPRGNPALPPASNTAGRAAFLQRLEDYARVPGLSDYDVAVLMGFRAVIRKGVIAQTVEEAFERMLRQSVLCFDALARGRCLSKMDASLKVAAGGPQVALETLKAISPDKWNPTQKIEMSGGMELRNLLNSRSDAELRQVIKLAEQADAGH